MLVKDQKKLMVHHPTINKIQYYDSALQYTSYTNINIDNLNSLVLV